MNLLHPWNAVFLVGFLVYTGIRHVYAGRLKNEKSVVHRIDGLEKVLLAFVMLGSLIAPALYLVTSWLDFADYELPFFAPWIGVVLMPLALVVFWRSHADLGRQWSLSLEVREEHRLITSGVYRSIRHPMYLAIWLWGAAQALLLANWIAGYGALVSFLPMYLLRTPREEALMLETFGDGYRTYKRRSGRILPRRAERVLHPVLSFAGSLWVVYTLYAVARYGGAVLVAPATTARIMGVVRDDVVTSAVGLTYRGAAGAVIVVAELAIVTCALLAVHSRAGTIQTFGFLILIAWAGLWFGNAMWLAALDGAPTGRPLAPALALVAILGWAVTRPSDDGR